MERLQKALKRLEERGVAAKIENDTLYVIVNDSELQLSEFEIDFQAGEIEERKSKNILGWGTINGIQINENIFNEDLFEYRIVSREGLIYDLMHWISEESKDKALMRKDLEMLMKLDDEYIFSSVSTNDYIHSFHADFDSTCEELLELNIKQNG